MIPESVNPIDEGEKDREDERIRQIFLYPVCGEVCQGIHTPTIPLLLINEAFSVRRPAANTVT